MKIKLTPMDVLFSKYIRLRANGKCEYCGKVKDFKQLQCSHFHGRRKKSVRWHEDNCAALCFGCHQHLGENPLEHTEWFKKRLGEKRFELLTIQANQPGMPDLTLLAIYFKQKVKELECG